MIRSAHEEALRDAQKFVSPHRASFDNVSSLSAGGRREGDQSKNTFDDTAVWANQMFANGLSSYLIPKAERWAYLKPQGIPSASLNDKELVFLEGLSNKVDHTYSVPKSQFYQAGHEVFHDLGSFGTAVVHVDRDKPIIKFKACPLADCFFDVNEESEVDTMYYRRFLSTKALIQMFPHVTAIDGFDPRATNRSFELVYSVEPSQDIRAKTGGRIGGERPFKATYWVTELASVLQEGHKSYFPYLVPRWMRMAGEIWGRSPAMTCMSQIRVINKMVKELLKSAELSNSPPLVAEDDSIMMPVQFGSNRFIFHEAGTPAPTALVSGSQPNLTLEMLRDYREQITKAFFVDQIIRDHKKERQSVTEIQDDRGQMLQQLGPLLARQETEYLSPAIEHTVEWLQDKRDPIFDQMPDSLRGQELEIVYTSPAAHAQYASGIGNMSAFLQDITPMMQQDPTIADSLDPHEMMVTYGRMRNVPRNIFRSEKAVGDIREGRAQQEQQQQQQAAMPEMAGAMKDIASAKATDPEGIGQLLTQ
jgi:hypothetical protein